MTVILKELPGGKLIVSDVSPTITVPVGGANQPVTITFRDLRRVEFLLQVNVTTDPKVMVSVPQDVKIDGNVVGMTLSVAAGTTLTVEGIAVGY